MGSFVYAMPDVRDLCEAIGWLFTDFLSQRYNPRQPLSTALYTVPSSLDFATSMAKALARKTKLPCYVGSSINLAGAAGGGTVEEEMEAFHAVVNVVITEVERSRSAYDDD